MIEFEHDGRKFSFFNALEEFVLERVRQKIRADAEMCKCAKCYYDVCALVLNSMGKAQYETAEKGCRKSRVPFDAGISASVMFTVEIAKAMNIVRSNPTH